VGATSQKKKESMGTTEREIGREKEEVRTVREWASILNGRPRGDDRTAYLGD
jgi:hypothetical protein